MFDRKSFDEVLLDQLKAERERFDALLERYHSLRFQGAVVPRIPANGAQQAPARDMDEIGRDGARREAIDRMAADLQRRGGVSSAEAHAEATRLIATLGPYEEE